MTRINLHLFLALSLALHAVALAHWSAPISSSARAERTLSIALIDEPGQAAATAGPLGAPGQTRETAAVPLAAAQAQKRVRPPRQAVLKRERKRPAEAKPPVVRPPASALPVPDRIKVSVLSDRALESAVAGVDAGAAAGGTPAASTVESPAPPTVTVATAVQPATASSAIAEARESAPVRIRGRLSTDLAHHFAYPWIARVRGWEGAVHLRFKVEPDGRLMNIEIAHSSGHRVLDRSALQTLERVGYLPEAIAWLNGETVDVELPVIYRLRER